MAPLYLPAYRNETQDWKVKRERVIPEMARPKHGSQNGDRNTPDGHNQRHTSIFQRQFFGRDEKERKKLLRFAFYSL
jgi:hypothetical protein